MADKISLRIDDREVSAGNVATVSEAAAAHGLYMSILCYHPTPRPFGACRLCIVEVEKMPVPPPAYTTPATDGTAVPTSPGGPFFDQGYTLCILCGQCVEACTDLSSEERAIRRDRCRQVTKN